jgi:hypothetical protein
VFWIVWDCRIKSIQPPVVPTEIAGLVRVRNPRSGRNLGIGNIGAPGRLETLNEPGPIFLVDVDFGHVILLRYTP